MSDRKNDAGIEPSLKIKKRVSLYNRIYTCQNNASGVVYNEVVTSANGRYII